MAQRRSAKSAKSLESLLQTRLLSIRLLGYEFSTDPDLLVKDDDEKNLLYQAILLQLKTEDDGTTGAITHFQVSRQFEDKPDVTISADYFFSIKFIGNEPESIRDSVEQVTRFAVWPLFRVAFAKTLSDAALDLPHLPLYPTIDWSLEEDKPITKAPK
jgi:hypothetical protein